MPLRKEETISVLLITEAALNVGTTSMFIIYQTECKEWQTD